LRWLSGTTNTTAARRKVIAIVVIWRDFHALPEGEADKAHKDNQGEKRDNPIRHSQILLGASVGGLCLTARKETRLPALQAIRQ
jgi:heme-degrading monooxygenase HmoA